MNKREEERKRKEEKARGRDGTLWIGNWNVTAPPNGDTEGEVGGCAVKLWDNAAKEWGDERVRKGDVVLLESRSQSFLYIKAVQCLPSWFALGYITYPDEQTYHSNPPHQPLPDLGPASPQTIHPR